MSQTNTRSNNLTRGRGSRQPTAPSSQFILLSICFFILLHIVATFDSIHIHTGKGHFPWSSLTPTTWDSYEIRGQWLYGALSSTPQDSEENGEEMLGNNQKETNEAYVRRRQRWVVLVDDEESLRLAVGEYLHQSGFKVTACADAAAVIEIIDESPVLPDVVISDVRMPETDGIELLRILKKEYPSIPVVMLTAKSMTQDRILGYREGCEAYLPKPFDPDELLAIIDNTIARANLPSANPALASASASASSPASMEELEDLYQQVAQVRRVLQKNVDARVLQTDVSLTKTERQTLELLGRGLSNREIADERGVGIVVVQRTVQKLYKKTSTRTRTELVRWAIQTGQISRS